MSVKVLWPAGVERDLLKIRAIQWHDLVSLMQAGENDSTSICANCCFDSSENPIYDRDVERLNYHHLLYFWTVAREGSISSASKQLGVAQPTISGQIHELEESLGKKLFARAGRGLVVTEAGQTVCRYAEQIFQLGSEMMAAVDGETAAQPKTFHVGVASTMSPLIASRLLGSAFVPRAHAKSHRPTGDPVLRAGCAVVRRDTLDCLLAELSLGRLELVLSDSQPAASKIRMHSQLLGESGICFFAPSGQAKLKRGFPRSLDGARMLLPAAGSVRRAIDRWLESERLRPAVIGEFDDWETMRAVGQAASGVWPAPALVEKEMKSYGVTAIGRVPGATQRFFAFSSERISGDGFAASIIESARASLSKG